MRHGHHRHNQSHGATQCSRRSRRSWIASLVLGLMGVPAASCYAQSVQGQVKPGEAQEIALVQAAARKAGLDPFSHRRSAHFLALGDADARFRNDALEICESLATDFLKHFRDKGFKLALPGAPADRHHSQGRYLVSGLCRFGSRRDLSAATTISTAIGW